MFCHFLQKMCQNRPKNGTFLLFLLFSGPEHQNIKQVQPQKVFGIPHDPLINSYEEVSLKILVSIIEQKSRPAANAPYVFLHGS